ncbi:MAG: hypothetical protein ABUT39_18950 [Acidobacteriota bacterium]
MARRHPIQEAQDDLSGLTEVVPPPDRPGDFWAAYEEFRRTHDLTSDPIDPDEIFVRDRAPDRDFSW